MPDLGMQAVGQDLPVFPLHMVSSYVAVHGQEQEMEASMPGRPGSGHSITSTPCSWSALSKAHVGLQSPCGPREG